MSTRFNSRKNAPNSKSIQPKRKVLKEFKKLQEQIRNIKQDPVSPPGDLNGGIGGIVDEIGKLEVSNGLFFNYNFQTMSSKLGLPKHGDPSSAMQQEIEAGSSFRSPFKLDEKQQETINGLARRFRSLDHNVSSEKFGKTSDRFRQSKNRYTFARSTLEDEKPTYSSFSQTT